MLVTDEQMAGPNHRSPLRDIIIVIPFSALQG